MSPTTPVLGQALVFTCESGQADSESGHADSGSGQDSK